jgi:quercetin dioxygenase-like cupin family protein
MKMRSRIAVLAIGLAGLAGVMAVGVYAITIEVPARGTFALKEDKVELARGIARLIGQPADAAVQRIVLNPGEGPNWHTHAGPGMVIVKSGNFTMVQDDCSEAAFSAGDVVVDEGFGNVHRAYNPGPGTTELWVTYVVPEGAGLIIPTSTPDCVS